MANYNVDNKKINKALALGFGITAVILLVVFGLIYLVTSFAGSTPIPVFIIVGFIVLMLSGTLYWWYQRAQKSK